MKSTIASRGLTIYICAALALTGSLFMSCSKAQKEERIRAMTTFVIGKVTLIRAGEPARPVLHKEELKQGDVVKTGPDSMLVVQIGGESLIKIESGTTLSMAQLLDGGNTRVNLLQGKLLTRVNHLGKESTFKVYTKTSLAAVRGTEFSVSSDKNQSVVAVNDGTVAVTRVEAGKETKDEKKVNDGNAAEVDRTIKTRPVNKEEEKDFDRLDRVKTVDNLDDTSEAELKQMEDDYQKNKDSKEDTGAGAGKDRKKDKDKKDSGRDTSSAKDMPAGSAEGKNTVLATSKGVYAQNEAVIVYYRNMPEYRNCWIDISKASDWDGRYRSYQWTYSAKNGKMTFSNMRLEPGVYEVRAHFSKSNAASKRYRFRVQ